jgi:hypothetical protein
MAAQKVHHIPLRHNLSSFKFLVNVGKKKRLPGGISARNSNATARTGRAASVTIMSVALVQTSP